MVISLATLLANDMDADSDTLTLAIQSGTTHGTLTIQTDGSLLYQPNAGFSGTDTFYYTLTEGAISPVLSLQWHFCGLRDSKVSQFRREEPQFYLPHWPRASGPRFGN